MNKDNAHLYLPLVQALADGKVIQRRDIAGNWCDSPDIFDGEPASRYRIKPEPREWWIVQTHRDVLHWFNREADASSFARDIGASYSKVREVLPP